MFLDTRAVNVEDTHNNDVLKNTLFGDRLSHLGDVLLHLQIHHHDEIISFIDALTIGPTDNLLHCVLWERSHK